MRREKLYPATVRETRTTQGAHCAAVAARSSRDRATGFSRCGVLRDLTRVQSHITRLVLLDDQFPRCFARFRPPAPLAEVAATRLATPPTVRAGRSPRCRRHARLHCHRRRKPRARWLHSRGGASARFGPSTPSRSGFGCRQSFTRTGDLSTEPAARDHGVPAVSRAARPAARLAGP